MLVRVQGATGKPGLDSPLGGGNMNAVFLVRAELIRRHEFRLGSEHERSGNSDAGKEPAVAPRSVSHWTQGRPLDHPVQV